MYALVDCNNFFASCERVFRPDLKNKPVVVLSNNDGCVIAHSQEAKALGIKMGAPMFKTSQMLKENNVAVFSSNFALYGDMSARVMQILEGLAPSYEIYSIDEAFLSIHGLTDLENHAKTIKVTVEQYTGIPISVGMAPTKTLAKLANHVGKRWPGFGGVCILNADNKKILENIEIAEVWGVGRSLRVQLNQMGIENTWQLANTDPRAIRRRFSVVVERMVRELQGTPCLELETTPPHPGQIIVSRGFKGRTHGWQNLREAVSLYATRAAEKARERNVHASAVTVTIRTSPFDQPQANHQQSGYYKNSATSPITTPTSDSDIIVSAAEAALLRIYKSGYRYQKAGIMLSGLTLPTERQGNLFAHTQGASNNTNLWHTVDKLNNRFGRETIQLAASGIKRPWWIARGYLSPCYTTRLQDIKKVG
jgi:DNA polymerase V